MRRIHPILLALFSLLLPAAAANAVTIVAPNGYAAVEGNAANSFPFNNFEGRYQQAYAADQFDSGLLSITEIAFRTDAGPAAQNWLSALSFTVNLSTSVNPVGSLSDIFADNIGLDQTLVFDSGAGAAFSGTNAGLPGPNAFDVILTLDTPFLYDPASGDLLLEVLMETNANALPLNGFSYLDAVESENDAFDVGVQRMFNSGGDVNALDAPNPDLEGAGLVTRFTYTVVPEPGTGLLFVAGLVALAARRRS